eukprot:s4408_g5.t1
MRFRKTCRVRPARAPPYRVPADSPGFTGRVMGDVTCFQRNTHRASAQASTQALGGEENSKKTRNFGEKKDASLISILFCLSVLFFRGTTSFPSAATLVETVETYHSTRGIHGIPWDPLGSLARILPENNQIIIPAAVIDPCHGKSWIVLVPWIVYVHPYPLNAGPDYFQSDM